MPDGCPKSFDETLLSGYIDGVLAQGDRQRVRLHLEDCPSCRAQLSELELLRETTLSTRFALPPDEQWSELPRGPLSRLVRGTGFWVVGIWAAALASFALYQLAVSPQGWLEKLAVFGGLSGFTLLLVSVLLDRLRDLKTDRYRGVRK